MLKIFLFSVFFLTSSFAGDYYLNVVKVPGNLSKVTPLSRAWMSTNYMDIIAYPQKSIITNSQDYTFDKPVDIKIKALYDGENIAILLKWKDSTKDAENGYSIDSFADGFSIDFAKDVEDFPYARNGSKKREVIEYFQKNVNSSPSFDLSLQEESKEYLKKEGISKYQKIFLKNGNENILFEKDFSMNMIYRDGFWLASLVRKLNSKNLKLNSGVFALFFSLYNGSKRQRGEIRSITRWIIGKFSNMSMDNRVMELLSSIELKAEGDIKNGKKLFLENCALCHRSRDIKGAPLYQAPDLSFVGGYGIYKYLKESLLNPSAVITDSYLPFKAHPNYPWYEIDKSGKRVSSMPSFDWMDEKNMEDIVAFLETQR